MATKQIETTIEKAFTGQRITANQLALCNVFYNANEKGLSLMEAARRIGKGTPSQIGGITSQLAQRIDKLGSINKQFGFTGYILLFERKDDRLGMRAEFRKVIDKYPKFKRTMMMKVREVFSLYKNGIDL